MSVASPPLDPGARPGVMPPAGPRAVAGAAAGSGAHAAAGAAATPATRDAAGEARRHACWLDAVAGAQRSRLRAAGLVQCMGGALLVPQAAAIAWVVQAVLVEGRAPATVLPAFALLAGAMLARTGCAWLAQRLAGDAADAIAARLRGGLQRAIHARGPLWLRGGRSGALSGLPVSHVDALLPYYAAFVPVRIEVMVVPLLVAAAVATVEPVVAVILLATGPLIPLFMMLVGRGAEAAGRAQLREMARLGAHFGDRLKALGLLRLYSRGQAEARGVRVAAERLRQRSLRVLRIAFLSSTVLEFFASASVAAVALYLGLSLLGEMPGRTQLPTLGAALFCLLLAPEFHAPLRRLAAHYHDRANALGAVATIEQQLEGLPAGCEADTVARATVTGDAAGARPEVRATDARVESGDATPPGHGEPVVAIGPCPGSGRPLQLRHAGAATPAVEGIALTLRRGERIALIGPSGCGKSTLLDALAGWLAPAAGRIERAPGLCVGHAGARPYLFPGSLADNLRIAAPGADAAVLRAAAQDAQVAAFADALPDGLDTVLGERGHGLSGGQARRVALARVLLRDPALVLLDEPTAFLDGQTESALLARLDHWLAGRTLVVATHSAAVLDIVDRVLELPSGRWLAPAAARARLREAAR